MGRNIHATDKALNLIETAKEQTSISSTSQIVEAALREYVGRRRKRQ